MASKLDQKTLELLLAKIDMSTLSEDDLATITQVKDNVEETKKEQERIERRKGLIVAVTSNLEHLKSVVKGLDIPTSMAKITRVWNLDVENLSWKTDDLKIDLVGEPASEEMINFVNNVTSFMDGRGDKMQKEFYAHLSAEDNPYLIVSDRLTEIGRQTEALDAIPDIENALGLAIADDFLTDIDAVVVKNESKGIITAVYDKKSATDSKWSFSVIFGKKSASKSSGNGKRVSVSTVSDYANNKEYIKAMCYGVDSPYYDEKLTKVIDDGKDFNATQKIETLEASGKVPEAEQYYRIAKETKQRETAIKESAEAK